MANINFKRIENEVWDSVNAIKHNPQARMLSREKFYKNFGDKSLGTFSYGNSELAFMKWEYKRAIRSPHAQSVGSEWWSAVNLWFIYLSELGAKAKESNISKEELPAPARLWYEFIENPTPCLWYRAHNSSIIDGYLKYPVLAKKEDGSEQVLINIVLYRLLFAQAMVEGKAFGFARLGRIFAHPKGSIVNLVTHFEHFYPKNYPMTKEDLNHLFGKSHDLGVLGMKLLDDVIIEPEFSQLYQDASHWNEQPGLLNLLVSNKPAYPDGIPKYEGEKKHIIKALLFLKRLMGL